jgi:hypothetical protein
MRIAVASLWPQRFAPREYLTEREIERVMEAARPARSDCYIL